MSGPTVQAYSFLDIQASMIGPGLAVILNEGSAADDEGISIEYSEPGNVMKSGADGSVMHSLIAVKSAKIIVRLLKISPLNGVLQAAANSQMSSSLTHGKNVFALASMASGDQYAGVGVAFHDRAPKNKYGKEGNMLEWEFDAGLLNVTLGLSL